MRFFLSIFNVIDELKKARDLEKIQQKFIDDMSASGHEYYDGSVWTEYSPIYKAIEGSDILIAFVDEYWMSSTWKASECWYAAGASPGNEGRYIDKPLLCYLHIKITDNPNINNLLNRKNVRAFNGTLEHLESLLKDT